MVVYGIVTSVVEEAVEFFFSRAEAEHALRQVLHDEPGWEHIVRVERIVLDGASNPN